MMEWQTDHQPQVPKNILELCMKGQHVTDPGFIQTYTRFLTSTGDVPNARATFERALSQPHCPLGMWDAFIEVRCTAAPPALQEPGTCCREVEHDRGTGCVLPSVSCPGVWHVLLWP